VYGLQQVIMVKRKKQFIELNTQHKIRHRKGGAGIVSDRLNYQM
jgi:hypothetical protein